MIRWQDLDPAKVERAIKALIARLHPGARAIDGSGDDDGQDIRWDSADEGLVIFEVKSYTRRLTNGQKRKIKASLTNAAAHDPVRWVLLMPLEPSPAEQTWFDGLCQDFPKIVLEWWDRAWLDGQFAGHEDLRRYIEGSNYELLVRSAELGHEQAALANGVPDLLARIRQLHERAQELSPAVRLDFSTEDGAVVFKYSARPDATLGPVVLRPAFQFPTDDPEAAAVQQQLLQTLDYGGEVTVEGRYVVGFDVDAPEEVRHLFDTKSVTELCLMTEPDTTGMPLPCTHEITTPDGEVVATIEVAITQQYAAAKGIKLVGADPLGVMVVTHLMDHAATGDLRRGMFNIGFNDVAGRYPWAVRKVADFVLALEPGNRLTARLGPVLLGYANIGEQPDLEAAKTEARMIVALDKLQAHFGQVFRIPTGVTFGDLREIETVAQLATGERVQWPYRGVNADIRSDRLVEFLAMDDIRQGAIVVRSDSLGFTWGDQIFQLGPVQLWGPKMQLANLAELEAAVGTGVDPKARWVCVAGEHLYLRQLSSIDETPVEDSSAVERGDSDQVAPPQYENISASLQPSRGHVFISYGRSNRGYVERLAEHLRAAGIPAWYDYELVGGDRWIRTIREQIETCAAFVVVMTPDAEVSDWVDREINHAEETGRPIFPLLLAGRRFFRLNNLQFDDVTSQQMPSAAIISRLSRLVDYPRQ